MSSPKIPKITLASSSKAASKETIYVDIEDEITGIIDKVTSSKSNIVALVLPKRASAMQSMVNMKLLKKTAEDAGKHVVLVTSEAALMPLAGVAGVFVAATPTSKPIVPSLADMPSDEAESVEESLDIVDGTADAESESDFDPTAEAKTPVGVLIAKEPESILMADADMPEMDSETLPEKVAETTKITKPNKKLKVPSFNKFRLGVALGVLLLLLLGAGVYAALVVLPKAGIAITTNSTTLNTDLNLTLDTTATKLDLDKSIIIATAQTTSKAYAQDTATTGQQNNGQKAAGTVYFALKDCAYDLVTIPAGSGVSIGSNTYITQATVALASTTKAGKCNPVAYQSDWSATVAVTAISAGTKYNADSGTAVSVPASVTGSTSVSAKVNQAIAGGTDNIVKIVAQTDIDGAKAKIASQDTAAIQQSLVDALKAKSLVAIPSTFLAGDPQLTTSANVGDKADTVKVTATVQYTMFGVKRDDLSAVLMQALGDKVNTKKQTIASDGLDNIKFSQQNPSTATTAIVLAKVKTVVGPKLDAATIRTQVAGKKAGDIKSTLKATPGVTDVQVMYSPFWVDTAPKNVTKITVVIDGQTK